MMRAGGIGLAALLMTGCVSTHMEQAAVEPACPAGQERLRTAQLFFGRNIGDRAGVTDADFTRFLDTEITPRFPDGLTVLDGGGQWRGPDSQLIRESSKVVLIVMPKGGDTPRRLDAVRNAYKNQFNQEAVLLVTQAACVSF